MPTHIQTHTCAPDLCAHPTCVRPILAPTRSVRPHDRHVRAESPVVSICTFSPNRSLFPPERAEKAVVRPWAWRQAGAECAAGERAEREMAACVCVHRCGRNSHLVRSSDRRLTAAALRTRLSSAYLLRLASLTASPRIDALVFLPNSVAVIASTPIASVASPPSPPSPVPPTSASPKRLKLS